MAVRLNHTIVAARDNEAAALFLTKILGLPTLSLLGPFAVVKVGEDTSPRRSAEKKGGGTLAAGERPET